MVTLTVEDIDDEIALEIALGVLTRAYDIHDNPDDRHEDVALELRDIGQNLLEKYE